MDDVLRAKIEDYTPKYIPPQNPITSIAELQEAGITGLEELLQIEEKGHLPFDVRVTRYYAGLIDPDNPDDPIRKLVVPTMEEIEAYGSQTPTFDTSNEKGNRVTPGLQHKYDSTLLAIISRVCPAFCRGCFRKRLWMSVDDIDGFDSGGRVFPSVEGIQYIIDSKGSDKEPNTILMTGGDAFMLTNESIRQILDMLSAPELDHIKTIRFGSKMAAYRPERIDDKLCEILADFKERTGKQVRVSVHFDHPNEFTDKTYAALDRMIDAGIGVYNQTVLSRGINDNPDALYKLTKEKLADRGVEPYYIFQCRPVAGAEQFQVPLVDGVRITNQMAKRLAGQDKPRYAMSSVNGKLLITEHPNDENAVYLTFHSANPKSLTGKTFKYDVAPNPLWVDRNWLDNIVQKYA